MSRQLRAFAQGPSREVTCYKGCFVNGFRFIVKGDTTSRTTQNYGVMVKGAVDGDDDLHYYGYLTEVLQLTFWGGYSVVMFNCDWINPTLGVIIDNKNKIIDVNPKSRYKSTDTFVLASQALQVTYISKVSKKGRLSERSHEHVLLIPPRISHHDVEVENDDVIGEDEFFQPMSTLPSPVLIDPVLDDAVRIPQNLIVWLDSTQVQNEEEHIDNKSDRSSSDNESESE